MVASLPIQPHRFRAENEHDDQLVSGFALWSWGQRTDACAASAGRRVVLLAYTALQDL